MGVRELRREETTRRIVDVAEEQIQRQGAPALSLRGVARDLDLAVSALYRYFPSRDDLLTAVITRAYHDCADAVEAAMTRVRTRRRDAARLAWTAAADAYRAWAHANPSRFLLIFGTPVPGYAAPVEPTRAAGTRIPVLLCGLLTDIDVPPMRLPAKTRRGLEDVAATLGVPVGAGALALGMTGWAAVHGHVMFELSGQLGAVGGDDGLFDIVVREQAVRLGL
ncbi:MAG: TetR/AcrR family transcriptional regulator [Actinomycetota bacterium]|nr:TetR/AcrR family transcriptional regulator [Actinomycetota bacterium]MDH4354161.1 TetR/AcrR family transcriptional regulator [Actinomycetota bacterium]MDH5278533.1 TetR/AcrR family transcriptional regulator [Actinomycetota bacterium]